jgi:hypothetical protein
MTDAFKEKFAEALGSELAPDFGAVLGEELISAAGDRSPDGDVGNWIMAEGNAGSSFTYNTDSMGGNEDKQWKLVVGDDTTYTYMSLAHTQLGTIDANSFYSFSAWIYADPNNTGYIFARESGFADSPNVVLSYPSGADQIKGVWHQITFLVNITTDVEGNIQLGYNGSGGAIGDTWYIREISLRKITFSDDWTAGTGWGPKFALTAPSLGDEELSNGDFSSVTEGSDLFDSGVGDYRDNTGSWAEYGTNTVANDSDALLITWVDSDRGAYLLLTDANDLDSDLTVGKQYRLTFYAKVETGESVEVDFYDGDTAAINIDTITATDFVEVSHDFIVLGATPDVHFDAMDAANDKIWVRDFTIKEITPTAPSVYGTPTATAYVETDEDAGTLRIVSDGDSVGVYDPAAISEGQLYFLEVDVASASGYLRVNNTGNKTYDYPSAEGNDVAVIEDAGVFSMVFEGGTANPIYLFCTNPGDDFTINSWSIKPYTPSHSNTDPRFDRQTESNVYTSDFSADEDGWATNYNGTTEGNIDGVDGEDDVLRFTCDDTDGPHIPRYMGGDAFTEGIRVRVRFDYYIPSGNNNLDGIRPGFDNGFITDTLTVTDSWTSVDVYATTEGSRFRIYGYDGGNFSFQDVTGTDYFAIKNVTIDAVTLSDYTGTNWYPYDENGGAIHVTGAAAGMQQTISSISEGDYVLVILKHSGRTAGGVAVYAGGTNTGLGVTVDGVYSAIAKWGSADYVNIYPSGIYDGVFEYCYIIPLSTPVAHCTGSQSAASNLSTGSNILVADANHKNVFTVDNRSAGTVKVYNGGLISSAGHGNPGPAVSSDDTYTHYLTESFERAIYVQANADFVGDITALSVKEVTRHAKGTGIAVWTPGYTESDLGGTGTGYNIIGVDDATAGMVYLNANTNHYLTSYDGANIALGPLNWTNTPYLIVWQWGDVLSNVNNMRIGAAAIDSPWDGTGYRSDVEFDGSFSLGTDLNLFYSKFGSNNLRDLMFFDSILTDAEIENIRRRIK